MGFGLIGLVGLFDPGRDYTLQVTITRTRTLVSTVTPLLGSGFQRRAFPLLWVPELSPASATSFSQQQLTTTEPQQFSH
jgi:hypothetical protein